MSNSQCNENWVQGTQCDERRVERAHREIGE